LRDKTERKRLVKQYGSVFFPQPVLPGNGSIVPIQTVDELFEEGQTMNNCVASYADKLKRGGCTMYRVLEPERCTLYVVRTNQRKVEIEEMRSFCNAEPSEETFRAVKDWIEFCELSEQNRISSEQGKVAAGVG
jgi:hypothetical protein